MTYNFSRLTTRQNYPKVNNKCLLPNLQGSHQSGKTGKKIMVREFCFDQKVGEVFSKMTWIDTFSDNNNANVKENNIFNACD